jgi:hypothetical protein
VLRMGRHDWRAGLRVLAVLRVISESHVICSSSITRIKYVVAEQSEQCCTRSSASGEI